MKPKNIIIVNESKGSVNLYHIRVEVAGVPLWTGVYAESVERANRIAVKMFGKGSIRGRPTKVKESKNSKGPHNKVKKGSQRREKIGFATDKPDKYIGKWEAYDEPQGINSPAGQKMVHAESEGMPTVKTFSPEQLAKKHGVSIQQILKQLKMGIEVELEHTTNRKLAREIALDHILELPDYYDRLEKMERVKEGDESSIGPSFTRGLTNSSSGLGAAPPESDFNPNELPNKLRSKPKVPGSKSPAKQVIKTVNKSTKNKVRKPNSPVTEDILNELFGGGNKLPYYYSPHGFSRIEIDDDTAVIMGFEDFRNYVPSADPGVNVGFATERDGHIHMGLGDKNLGLDSKTLIALFNTIIELVQRWVKDNKPNALYFIAVESMKNIYPKLLNKFVPMDEWTVKKGGRQLQIMGANLDVYKVERKNQVDEMARLPMQNQFNADYEIKNGEKLVGKAKVTDGVIEELMINQEDDTEDFKGHTLSTTLGTIIRDADIQGSNLAIQIVDPADQDMKRFMERFGFRHVGNGVMKRTAGAITPPSVIEKKHKT